MSNGDTLFHRGLCAKTSQGQASHWVVRTCANYGDAMAAGSADGAACWDSASFVEDIQSWMQVQPHVWTFLAVTYDATRGANRRTPSKFLPLHTPPNPPPSLSLSSRRGTIVY